jgi:hypothetical protein
MTLTPAKSGVLTLTVSSGTKKYEGAPGSGSGTLKVNLENATVLEGTFSLNCSIKILLVTITLREPTPLKLGQRI